MSETSRISGYAHPDVLVTTEWLEQNSASVKIVECDEDVLLYEVGHIPGAVKLDWHTELNDQDKRDYLTGSQFAELMKAKGIDRKDTIVLYGDRSNWWATAGSPAGFNCFRPRSKSRHPLPSD